MFAFGDFTIAMGLTNPPDVHKYDISRELSVYGVNPFETLAIYREIFKELTYLQHGIRIEPGACVVDVGANIGLFAVFAHRQAPDVTVLAVEPMLPTVACLRRNFELNGVNGTIISVALSGCEGVAEMTFYPNSPASSGAYADVMRQETVTRSVLAASQIPESLAAEVLDSRFEATRHQCPQRKLSTLIREHGIEAIDLLKIDVEGSEVDVLDGIEDGDWQRIRQIVLEVHDEQLLAAVLGRLRHHGFAVVNEQPAQLRGTSLQMVYAVRPDRGSSRKEKTHGQG
jgi:FkbM family methyltransferase